jgi:ABC-type Fe3+ transport system permease subunit
MSKSEGPHDAVKQAATPEPGKPPSRLQSAIQLFTALSLFFVVMTPITYFIGRAYHDGWYDELGLDGSLFPLDTASMLTQGFEVAGDGFGKLAVASFQAVASHSLVLLSFVLIAGLTIGALKWMQQRSDERRASKPKKPTQDQQAKQRSFRFHTTNAILTVLLVFFAFYEVVFGFSLGVAILTQPFYLLGKDEAKQFADKGFNLSPMVTAKSPTGDVPRREIGCGPAYCALWGDGHASQAPIASVGWADAPPPKNLPAPGKH